MSNPFKSTVIRGTRITDFGNTSAEIGIPLPFGYGRVVVNGNVIFAPLPPIENRQVRRQGKGGVKQETYTYTLSYAVAFLAGPCYGYLWIKRNGKVVWTQDPNASADDLAYAAKWADRVSFYYGTREQLPDAVIESYEGVGNVSAFKQLAYIVVEDEDVTENGGAVPSYEACIIASPPECYLTSKVFAQFFETESEVGARVADITLFDLLKQATVEGDDVEEGFAFTGGTLVDNPPQATIDNQSHELAFTGGVMVEIQNPYTNDPQSHELAFTGGALILTPTGEQQADNQSHELAFTGGELWVP